MSLMSKRNRGAEASVDFDVLCKWIALEETESQFGLQACEILTMHHMK